MPTIPQKLHQFTFLSGKPRLTIDLLLPNNANQEQSRNNFVKKLRHQNEKAYKFLQVDQTKRKQDIRKHDNQFASLSTLQPSDRVLIRNLSERKFILSN